MEVVFEEYHVWVIQQKSSIEHAGF